MENQQKKIYKKTLVYNIDSTDRPIGRVAVEAAVHLMGKNLPQFRRHIAPKVLVRVENVNKIKINNRKLNGIYRHYSGYPGGLKETTLGRIIANFGTTKVLRHMVFGMLPKNKLRPRMIKNLEVSP